MAGAVQSLDGSRKEWWKIPIQQAELSLGLAPVIVESLAELLVKIKEEQSLSILLVEQDVEIALGITDRGYVMESGQITLSGSRDELSQNEHVRSAYLGL